jgi:hypothetical protein
VLIDGLLSQRWQIQSPNRDHHYDGHADAMDSAEENIT